MAEASVLSQQDRELFRDTFRKFLKNEVAPLSLIHI